MVRVAIATLRNLCRADGEGAATSFAEVMIDAGLLTTLENFRERKWTDADIGEDLEALDAVVRESALLVEVGIAPQGNTLVVERRQHGALRRPFHVLLAPI